MVQELRQLHQLRLGTAFAAIAFFIIIAAVEFTVIAKVKKLDLDFRRFFGLNPVYYCRQNFDWGLISSSLLYLIVIVLSFVHFLLYSIIVTGSCFLPLDFKQLFLRFADFDVGQVLVNFESLANRFHHRQVFHYRRKLGKDIAMG